MAQDLNPTCCLFSYGLCPKSGFDIFKRLHKYPHHDLNFASWPSKQKPVTLLLITEKVCQHFVERQWGKMGQSLENKIASWDLCLRACPCLVTTWGILFHDRKEAKLLLPFWRMEVTIGENWRFLDVSIQEVSPLQVSWPQCYLIRDFDLAKETY